MCGRKNDSRWNIRKACRLRSILHRTKEQRAVCLLLAGVLLAGHPAQVLATSRSDMERERDEMQQELNEASREANEAQANLSQVQGEVSDLTAELTDLLAEMELLDADIVAKQGQIDQAQKDYDDAKATEQQQYEDMKKRIKYMYEKGDTEFLDVLLMVKSMSELLNKSEYIESIYKYDREKLLEYQETKQKVQEYQEVLNTEMNEMEGMQLEYQEQKAALETTLAEKRQQVSNFDAQLAQAKAAVATYKQNITKKNEEIRKAEEEEKKRQEEERKRQEEERLRQQGSTTGPAATSVSTNKNTPIKSTGGTAAGREIADYALQFVGNRYVYGGTSLTNGTDCSGFTQSVYKHFGYTLPRTSADQRSAGYAVDYSDAQPGDIICYPGHVGLYIGNGQIVHASNAKNGIMVSSATYRSIMAVRRIIN